MSKRYLYGKATRHKIYVEMRKWFDDECKKQGNTIWYSLCYALTYATKQLHLNNLSASDITEYPELLKHEPRLHEDLSFWFDRCNRTVRVNICDQAIQETQVKPRKKKGDLNE